MYKCTECGCEFENKPDFCDCGNDEFIFEEKKQEEKLKQELKQEETIPIRVPEEENIQEFREPVQKAEYTGREFYRPQIDMLSLGIFLTCIIISFVVLFFLWNPKESEITQSKENPIPVSQNIPSSVNKFWNDTPPAPVSKPLVQPSVTAEQTVVKPQPVKTVIQQTNASVKNQNTTSQKPVTKAPAVKPAAQKPTTTKPTNSQPVVKTTQTNISNQQKPATKPVQTQSQQQTQQTKTSEQPKPAVQTQTPVQVTVPSRSTQEITQEFNNYKASLRNTIGRKIDFTRVIGDGSCAVSFKINENGKLVNRSFSQQSTNMTLNDAVYAAVMSTPTFNPPPEGYKGEFLKLSIKFYNGNFEISLN